VPIAGSQRIKTIDLYGKEEGTRYENLNGIDLSFAI
jgi:hypothetical protein